MAGGTLLFCAEGVNVRVSGAGRKVVVDKEQPKKGAVNGNK